MAKVDVPELKAAPTSTGRWVEVPEKDLFDTDHPPIRINASSYGPGKHFLPNDLADTVEERLRAYSRANVRILQPKKDAQSEQLVNKTQGVATTGF